ncbi:MAG: HEAT repeat domain-containing protein, partial [Planctomycetota bacterium]
MGSIRTLFTALALFASLLSLVPRAVADDAAPEPTTVEGILEVISDRQDKTPRHLIEALGKMKSEEGLAALESSVDLMKGRWPKQYVFSAMRHCLKEPELAERAVAFALDAALDDEPAAARAAAGAMAKWGMVAEAALYEVAEDGWDAQARALSVRGIHGILAKSPDAKSLEIMLSSFRMSTSGSFDQAVRLFAGFLGEKELKRLGDFVKAPGSRLRKVYAVLDAFGGHSPGMDRRVDDAIERAFGLALKRKDPAVQYRALRAIAQRGSTRHEKQLKKLIKSKDAPVRQAAILAGIAAQGRRGEEGDRVLGRWFLDSVKLARSKDAVSRQAAAIGLGGQGGEEALEVLHGLIVDQEVSVRAEAVRSLVRLRDASSIPVLIDGLATAEGRMRLDFRLALTRLTALDLGLNPARWRTFWSKEGEGFTVPTPEEAEKAAAERAKRRSKGGSEAAFYGIDVLSEAFALVVDTSGSMNAKVDGEKTRLDVAKEQIAKTIDRVKDGVLFNVVPFSGASRPFAEELVPLTPEAREAVAPFIERLNEAGGTNIFDALDAAFEDDRIDTIYLLSDGAAS